MSRNKAKKQSHNARMSLKRDNNPKIITCICGVSGGGQSLFNRLSPQDDEFGSYAGTLDAADFESARSLGYTSSQISALREKAGESNIKFGISGFTGSFIPSDMFKKLMSKSVPSGD